MNDRALLFFKKKRIIKRRNQLYYSYFPAIFSKEEYIIMVLDKGFVISLS
jgi:hypothetical protein